MRITTWNVNGLRAALRKEFEAHVRTLDPHVLLLQEIRCRPDQLPTAWRAPEGWHAHWHPSERAGYSGVATWSRSPIEVVDVGMGQPDPEGRVLDARIGGIRVVNVYLPSGARLKRQAEKEAWMDRFLPWAAALAASDEPVILGGDLNIAHTERDIHNARGNAGTSGFLPHEREWFTTLLASGWTDVGRAAWGDRQGPYSWWSNFGRARAEDRGWRIDYLLANAAASSRCTDVHIHRAAGLDTSDHAPVTLTFTG